MDGKKLFDEEYDMLRFLHPSLAFEVTGQLSFRGFNNLYAIALQPFNIPAGGDVAEHVQIHGRRYKNRRLHGEVGGDKHVVGHSVSHLGQGGGSGGSYNHQVGPQAEVHVAVPGTVATGKKLTDYGSTREGGEGNRRDELLAGRCDHNLHLRSPLYEQTGENGRLIGGDAAGNTQDDMFPL